MDAAPPLPRAWLLAVAGLTVVLLLLLPRPLSPDVAGQLWIAERILAGVRLYRDIGEINPPLWFWLAMPVDAAAAALGVRADTVLIVGVGGAAGLSLWALDRLLPGRRLALLYGAAVLLVMPWRDFGQREQLALMGALPYAALVAARRDGARVPPGLALGVAGGAAIGFAFKHYFVAPPLLLELWLAAGQGRAWRPWRPELLVLAGAALAYGAAVAVVTPDYWRLSVPELALAYRGTDWAGMLRPAQPVWVILAVALPRWRGLPGASRALAIAAAGFALAWAVQGKFWPYQSIATTGLGAMALATGLAPRVRPSPIAGAALVAPLLLPLFPTHWAPTAATDVAPALAGLRAGETVALISVEARTAWPATMGRGLVFVGRRWAYWMWPAVAAHPDDPRLAAFGRQVVRDASFDLACRPPRRIVFAPGAAAGGLLPRFRADPAFAAVLAHYRPVAARAGFDAFELAAPWRASGAAGCRRV